MLIKCQLEVCLHTWSTSGLSVSIFKGLVLRLREENLAITCTTLHGRIKQAAHVHFMETKFCLAENRFYIKRCEGGVNGTIN